MHSEILFFDTKSWFLENNKVEDFDEFKRSLFDKVDRGFIEFPDRVLLRYMLEKFFETSSVIKGDLNWEEIVN